MPNFPKEWGNNFYKSGWQPDIEVNEQTGLGHITHVGTDPNYRTKFDEILRDWGFDPKFYEIEGAVRASSWNAQLKGGETTTFFAFKGVVKKKRPGHDKYFQSLFKQAGKKPPITKKFNPGDTAFMWFMSDWQLGKKDFGVEDTIKRYDQALQDGVNRIKDLRKLGVEIDEIYMVGMGDLTENCTPFFFESQPHSVSLSLIEQYALARSMIMKTIDTFLPHSPKLVLAGVPGNHGEMTRTSKGQVASSRLDNSDTMHLEICREIMSANPDRYGKVEVNVPDGFHQTLIIKGKKVSFTHGHMSGGSGNPEAKIENWWKGQMYGWLPPGDAEILVTAHYHHLRMKQQGDRTWFQCPSIDASIDFTARTGLWSHPGVLTFTINDKGWDNYHTV
jgi:curved DNA-binding protein CbpA